MKKTKLPGLLALATVAALTHQANAAIIVTPNGATGTVSVTQDISFTITTASSNAAIVFDNWVSASDGSMTTAGFYNAGMVFQNGSASGYTNVLLTDNLNFTFNEFTPTDGFFSLANFTVATGDVITLKAGNYTYTPFSAGFTPGGVLEAFTGNMFMASMADGARISDNVSAGPAVPEPAAALTGLLSLGLLGLRRRR